MAYSKNALTLMAFNLSKVNIKVVFFIMILIGPFFYVPREHFSYMPIFYDYIYSYLKYFFLFLIIAFTVPVFIRRNFEIHINKFVVIISMYVAVCMLSLILNPNKAL
jgi:hypothetical protein